jgi:hypothetical protein
MGRNRTIIHCTAEEKKLLDEVPAEIRSLIGVASSITDEDIAMDDKLAYLLNK